jgi:polygalacturonase
MSLTKATNSMIKGAQVNVLDFGAIADTSNNISGQLANANHGTDCTAAFRAALLAGTGGTVRVPAGNYTITDTLTIPASTGFVCDKRAVIHYFDTTNPGSYLFEIGVGGAGFDGSSVYTKNLYVFLRSGTAKGIYLGNSRSSTFENTYIEGWVPPAPYTGIELRTSAGLRIVGSTHSVVYILTMSTLASLH